MPHISDLAEFLEEVSGTQWIWYAKYLAPNDTRATGSHQVGPLIANSLFEVAFPRLLQTGKSNARGIADAWLHAYIDSHPEGVDVRIVWYRSKTEGRITNWGRSQVPILDADRTGALVLFAFAIEQDRDAASCRVWICTTPEEEDFIRERVGAPELRRGGIVHSPAASIPRVPAADSDLPCSLKPNELPERWTGDFPSGQEIAFEAAERLRSKRRESPDERLVRRVSCEYELFRSVEQAAVLPRVLEGFTSMEQFIEFALIVTNRRKARAGRSLELHMRLILDEEHVSYSWSARTEGKQTPDFIFPSIERYRDLRWPPNKLRMLAAKTTLKDRWRQILQEAKRVKIKHLLTLQPGLSTAQCDEIAEADVILVIPGDLHSTYPRTVRSRLLTVADFVRETKLVTQAE